MLQVQDLWTVSQMLDNEINVFKVFGAFAFSSSVVQFGDRNVRNKTVLKTYGKNLRPDAGGAL